MDLALAETASHDPLGRLAKLQPKPVFGTLLRRTGRQHRGKACAWWAVSAYALSQVQCRELHLRSIGVISNQESCQNIPVWSREGSGCPRYWSSPDSSCLRSDNNLTSTCTEFNVSLLSSWIFLVSTVSLFFSPHPASHLENKLYDNCPLEPGICTYQCITIITIIFPHVFRK